MKCFLYFETSHKLQHQWTNTFCLEPTTYIHGQKTQALDLQFWHNLHGCQISKMTRECNDFTWCIIAHCNLGIGPSDCKRLESAYPQVSLVDQLRERSLRIFFYVKKMVSFDMEWNSEHTIIDNAHNTQMVVLDNKHYIDNK